MGEDFSRFSIWPFGKRVLGGTDEDYDDDTKPTSNLAIHSASPALHAVGVIFSSRRGEKTNVLGLTAVSSGNHHHDEQINRFAQIEAHFSSR